MGLRFVSGRHVCVGLSYVSKSADDRMNRKTKMLLGHWRDGGEKRRGEGRGGELR